LLTIIICALIGIVITLWLLRSEFSFSTWRGNIQYICLSSLVGAFRAPTLVQFDSRVFVLPESEVCNYFIWRQQDWERNSIQMLAQSLFTHKECHKKNMKMLKDMCKTKGKNWDKLAPIYKSGTFINKTPTVYDNNGKLLSRGKWVRETVTPRFDKDRDVINKLLITEE